MAKVFSEWTVLPHDPIERVADNLWRVTGMMGTIQRQMVLARMADGRVVVDNAIALDEPGMAELERWGEPAVLIVPNGYHRQDARIWKQRYPRIAVVAPPRGKRRIEQVVRVDHLTTDAPGDATVRVVPMDGCANDTLLEIRSGDDVTLAFCDAVLNLPPRKGLWGFMLAPTGTVSTPRIQRWMGMQDKRAFAAHLDRLAATPGLRRLLFGHGRPVTDDAPAALRQVARQLTA
jgi:hypothetical protein